MLRIWGRTNSINVQKVLWTCAELDLEYERIDAGLAFGVNNTPEYKAMNPNGLVPTIDDDGFILWESHAIVRYLARRHGVGTLWPDDPRVGADADRWMDWYHTTLFVGVRVVFQTLVRTPPEKRNMAEVEENRLKAIVAFDILEAHLAKRDYVAGKAFTIGDIPAGVATYRWLNLPIERPPIPNVERWHQRLAGRPVYKERCMLPLT